jgi:hypothetical protein
MAEPFQPEGIALPGANESEPYQAGTGEQLDGLEIDMSAFPPPGVSMGGDFGAQSIPQQDSMRGLQSVFDDGRQLAPYGLQDTGMLSDEKYQQLTGDIGMASEDFQPASEN